MSGQKVSSSVRRKYEFIKKSQSQHKVSMMCRLLDVSPSGYYAWLQKPVSDRAREDARQLRLIRASFRASQGVYGGPRIFLDLREAGETCSKHRVARLMRENGVRAKSGYRTRCYVAGGKPAKPTPTSSSATSPSHSPIVSGSPTSRMSGLGRGGSTWPWFWTFSRAKSSDGPPATPFIGISP